MIDPNIQAVIDDLKIFDKMYDLMRFVDPIKKQIIHYEKKMFNGIDARCLDFWEKDEIGENCISIRAYNENQMFIKVEYTSNNIYMITAIPVEIANIRMVIELLKDVTNNLIFENGDYEGNSQIYALINRLNNLTLTDTLTGVHNRRFINEKMPIDLINTKLSGQSLAIIMVDIDFFKEVNDIYGHGVGDCALKGFAKTIVACVNRESDWVARYGGEEFIICLPGAPIEKAIEIAQNMRKAVETNAFICRDKTINLTASFGVSCMHPAQDTTIESLLDAVDQKLYAAKQKGRNRVEW